MKTRIPRRQFLQHAALGGAGVIILKSAHSAWSYQANEKLNVALIGVGGRGTWFVDTIPRMENVVAICDINDRKIAEAYKRWADLASRFSASKAAAERSAAPDFERLDDKRVPAFHDFREMLQKLDKQIDAVIVATSDHTHAVASAASLRAGKHVFCEKPLTRTVHESRVLRELARKNPKLATSMGNQGTASGPFRRALELIRDGTLGEIKEVHVWNSAGGSDKKQPPQGNPPIPDHLKWDLWLGPAAVRPYHPEWMQRNNWRDFGTCQLGNWAEHSANLAFMSLKVHELWQPGRPNVQSSKLESTAVPLIRIEAETSGINRLSFPHWEKIRWHIPARAEFPPITIHWHNGQSPGTRDLLEGLISDGLDWGDKKEKKWMDHAGAIIVGTQGTLHATGHNATFRLLPEAKFAEIARDRPKTVEASRGHEMDWFMACRGGKPAWANFEYAVPLTEFLMLGNVATQFQDKLEFDPAAMKIVNHSEAGALLRAESRRGWTL